MHGDHLPEDRWNPFDERHVAGAFRDNRVIPFEGACVKNFTQKQKKEVVESVGHFIEYLPAGPLRHRLQQVEEYIDESECAAYITRISAKKRQTSVLCLVWRLQRRRSVLLPHPFARHHRRV